MDGLAGPSGTDSASATEMPPRTPAQVRKGTLRADIRWLDHARSVGTPTAMNLAAMTIGAAAVPIVIAARFIAVGVPTLLAWSSHLMSARNVPFLTWAGVRGGISVALALSVPDGPAKPSILAATYSVVLFSVIVQGSTLGFVARRTVLAKEPEDVAPAQKRKARRGSGA